MNFTVIPMTTSHLDQVTTLESICFSNPWTKSMLEESLLSPTTIHLIALHQSTPNQILGYLGVTVIADEGYINNVAVLPDHQQKGVASALLSKLCSFGKEHLAFLTLEVRASNKSAICLYEKFNFQKEAIRPNYYTKPKEHAYIMTLRFQDTSLQSPEHLLSKITQPSHNSGGTP